MVLLGMKFCIVQTNLVHMLIISAMLILGGVEEWVATLLFGIFQLFQSGHFLILDIRLCYGGSVESPPKKSLWLASLVGTRIFHLMVQTIFLTQLHLSWIWMPSRTELTSRV